MTALSAWFAQLQNTLKAAYTRAPVLLQDDASLLQKQLNTLPLPAHTLWLNSGGDSPLHPPQGCQIVQPNQAQHWLGSEQQLLIADGFSGVDPNMLLALSGTLQAGSVLLLLMPKTISGNPALKRFLSTGQTLPPTSPFMHWLLQTPGLLQAETPAPPLAPYTPPKDWTTDQQYLLEAAAHWTPRDTVLITGRRGRGKSTLLAELIQRTSGHSVLVTNHRSAVHTLLKHLQQHGWQPAHGVSPFFSNSKFFAPAKTLEMLPPDAFLAKKPPFDTLFVDEAARLTLPVLQKLLTLPGKKILATTQEGYEGSGQGLRLKLETPYLYYALRTPTRWRQGDWLEQWLDEALLLDTALPPAPQGRVSINRWQPVLAETSTLKTVYTLLKQAHYQTRPSDLMQLLDAPHQHFWLARCGEKVAGVLWAVKEGGLKNPPEHVRGHLAAQRLAQLEQDTRWLEKSSLRITRIAVHPDRQGEGIGSALVEQLKTEAHVDFLSVSCAAAPQVMRFWQKLGFIHHSTGHKPNRASGLPSALLYLPLTRRSNSSKVMAYTPCCACSGPLNFISAAQAWP